MELMKMMKLNVSCRFIKRYMFSYITKPCSGQDEPYWSKCSLFCLPFKIYERIETNIYYYCTCKPFLCEKYYNDPDHQRLPNCYNCKIDGDCAGLGGHWQHCILYNCETYSFRDNLSEIVRN